MDRCQVSQTICIHRERHVRPDAVWIAIDQDVNGELSQGRKRVGRQKRQENDRIEFQQVFGLDKQVQIGADFEDVKFLHRATDGSEPDASQEHLCFQHTPLRRKSQLRFR